MTPERLLRLYPRAWRERYGREFVALLQQTRVGWRQLVDVLVAASREWARVMFAPSHVRSVAAQGRRGFVFYGMALLAIVVTSVFPSGSFSLNIVDPMAQVAVAALFLSSAAVCWSTETIGLRLILRGRASFGEAFVVVFVAYLIATIAARSVSTTMSFDGFVDRASFGIVIMFAEWFARPRGIQLAMHQTYAEPPSTRNMGVAS